MSFANKAMAHLKMGNALAAEQDCSAALQLDEAYLKAWLRRASARRALRCHLDAVDDLEQALRCIVGDALLILLTTHAIEPCSCADKRTLEMSSPDTKLTGCHDQRGAVNVKPAIRWSHTKGHTARFREIEQAVLRPAPFVMRTFAMGAALKTLSAVQA